MKTEKENVEQKLLAALALAFVEHPGASLQELAKAVNIGKTTLHRFCRTRQELIDRLIHHTAQVLGEAIAYADLDSLSPREALHRLTSAVLEHKELTAFLMYYWKDSNVSASIDVCHEESLDAFFMRGQHAGVFRIDASAAALTEIWFSVVAGLADAERRGRVARAGLVSLTYDVLLNGITTETSP